MIRFLLLVTFSFWTALRSIPSSAENWAQWRGPHFNGSSEETGLPSKWSKTENIAWTTPLPGSSGATPCVWGDRVFVSSLDNETQDLVGFCIDKKNGTVLWKKTLGIGFGDAGRGKNMASPSPVSDGKRVYFLFGSMDFAALDFEGNILWKRNFKEDFGKNNILFGYHSSPLLYKGKLYVQMLQRDHPPDGPTSGPGIPADSFLLAVDPETGKDLWKHVRPTDADEESHDSYATPIPYEGGGRSEILLIGGDCLSGHDPETGREFWRWGSWNPTKINHWRIVPSPVTSEGFIYACTPKGSPVYVIKAGGNGRLSDDAIAWQLKKNTSDVCVPLLYKDRLHVLDGDKKILTCLDRATGEVKWDYRLDGNGVFRGSPTGADGKIYVINEEGEAVVLEAGDKAVELCRTNMGEGPCRSSIAVSDGHLFIRTAENLYCVGKQN
jgi:outer membrane protein assembly factor BamB